MNSKKVQIFNVETTGRSLTRRSKSSELLESNKLEFEVDKMLLALKSKLEKMRRLVEEEIEDEI